MNKKKCVFHGEDSEACDYCCEENYGIGWQLHPSTGTAHAFSIDSRPGDAGLCKRELRTDGDLVKKPGIFPCTRCEKKLNDLLSFLKS